MQMSDSVKAELDGLFKRRTFKIVVLPDPSSANVLPTKFVYSINHEDGREIYKARFVIGGHRDKRKNHVIHTSPSLSHTSVRLLLVIAFLFGWDVWTEDVQQAYFQSASFLQRDMLLRPNGIELCRGELLQLTLPPYGLSEAGDFWSETLTSHCIDDVNFEQNVADISLFFK
jgi:Reverse transcriptase (RNA-dependent DNA polymerase)